MLLDLRSKKPTISFGLKGHNMGFETILGSSGEKNVDHAFAQKPVQVRISDREHESLDVWERMITLNSSEDEADSLIQQLRHDPNAGLIVWRDKGRDGKPYLSIEFLAERTFIEKAVEFGQTVINSNDSYEVSCIGYVHWQPVEADFVEQFCQGKAVRTVELHSITISPTELQLHD